MGVEIPIVVFGFDRAKNLRKSLKRVLQVTDGPVYVILDGPRDERDALAISDCVKAIEGLLQPRVKLHRYSNNLGLSGVPQKINWVFEHEEEALFVEDDVLISRKFYRFVKAFKPNLLAGKYFSIGGYQPISVDRSEFEAISSPRFVCWGWYTNRANWNQLLESEIGSLPQPPSACVVDLYETAKDYDITQGSWDLTVALKCLSADVTNILPPVNLVRNIGLRTGQHGRIRLANLSHNRNRSPLRRRRLDRSPILDVKTNLKWEKDFRVKFL